MCETAQGSLGHVAADQQRKAPLFLSDTFVTEDPSAEEISEMADSGGSRKFSRFGIEPKIALLSLSNFGSRDTASSRKMREALEHDLGSAIPKLEADGEMHGDSALERRICANASCRAAS